MKNATTTPRRVCLWCETSGPAQVNCAHCGATFSTLHHDEYTKPAPRDSYTPAQREAFKQLDTITSTQGSR